MTRSRIACLRAADLVQHRLAGRRDVARAQRGDDRGMGLMLRAARMAEHHEASQPVVQPAEQVGQFCVARGLPQDVVKVTVLVRVAVVRLVVVARVPGMDVGKLVELARR